MAPFPQDLKNVPAEQTKEFHKHKDHKIDQQEFVKVIEKELRIY